MPTFQTKVSSEAKEKKMHKKKLDKKSGYTGLGSGCRIWKAGKGYEIAMQSRRDKRKENFRSSYSFPKR